MAPYTSPRTFQCHQLVMSSTHAIFPICWTLRYPPATCNMPRQSPSLRLLRNISGKRADATLAHNILADLNAAKDYARRAAVGTYRYTGSCSMMPKRLGGVVDPQFWVYGCKNLRVCDASIIPIAPGTNPQATIYSVAEHGSKIVKLS
jgi:choline dehydrogenase-like flavoprotein